VPVDIIFPTTQSSIASDGPVVVVLLANEPVTEITVSCYRKNNMAVGVVGVLIDVGPVNGFVQWTFVLDLSMINPHGDFLLPVVWKDSAGKSTAIGEEFTVHPVPHGGVFATLATRITSPATGGVDIPSSNYVTTGTYAAALETGAGTAAGGLAACTAGYPCLWNSAGAPVTRSRLVTIGGNWSATYASVTPGSGYTERIQDKGTSTTSPVSQTITPLRAV
jgi:hypothetical protein